MQTVCTAAVKDFEEDGDSFQTKWIRKIFQEVIQFNSFCCLFLDVSLFREIIPQEGPMMTNQCDLVKIHLLGTQTR